MKKQAKLGLIVIIYFLLIFSLSCNMINDNENKDQKADFLIIPKIRSQYGLPAWGPTNWIAFLYYPIDKNKNYIFDSAMVQIVRPDGSQRKRLVYGSYNFLDWSNDGKWLTGEMLNKQIYKISFNGDTVIQVTYNDQRYYHYSTWSSNDKLIAYSVWGFVPFFERSIWVIPAEGGEPQLLFSLYDDMPTGREPDWSPVGSEIVFVKWKRIDKNLIELSQLAIYDTTTHNTRILFANKYGIEWPRFSPDGQKIAFQMQTVDGGDSQIFIIDKNTGMIKQITFDGGISPSWSPDGRKIVFKKFSQYRSKDPQNGTIWIINSDGSNPVQLTYNEF